MNRLCCAFTALLLGIACATEPTGHDAGSGTDAGSGRDAGSSPDGGPGATEPLGSFLQDLQTTFCDLGVQCGVYSDTTLCAELSSVGVQSDALNGFGTNVAVVNAGKAQYDPAEGGACLQALASLPCAALWQIGRVVPGIGGIPFPSSCYAAFGGGTVASGGACVSNAECANGAVCVQGPESTCGGTCSAPSTSACDPISGAPCLDGEVCFQTGITSFFCRTNAPPGGLNEPCGGVGLNSCAPGLICNDAQVNSICVTPGGIGDRCSESGLCAPGLACEATTATCEPGTAPWQSCANEQTCAAGYYCLETDDGSTFLCMKPTGIGEPCMYDAQCWLAGGYSNFICDETNTHTCIVAPSSGPCTESGWNTCNGGTSYCDVTSGTTGTCTSFLPLGAACPAGGPECGFIARCVANDSGSSAVGNPGTCVLPVPLCTP